MRVPARRGCDSRASSAQAARQHRPRDLTLARPQHTPCLVADHRPARPRVRRPAHAGRHLVPRGVLHPWACLVWALAALLAAHLLPADVHRGVCHLLAHRRWALANGHRRPTRISPVVRPRQAGHPPRASNGRRHPVRRRPPRCWNDRAAPGPRHPQACLPAAGRHHPMERRLLVVVARVAGRRPPGVCRLGGSRRRLVVRHRGLAAARLHLAGCLQDESHRHLGGRRRPPCHVVGLVALLRPLACRRATAPLRPLVRRLAPSPKVAHREARQLQPACRRVGNHRPQARRRRHTSPAARPRCGRSRPRARRQGTSRRHRLGRRQQARQPRLADPRLGQERGGSDGHLPPRACRRARSRLHPRSRRRLARSRRRWLLVVRRRVHRA